MTICAFADTGYPLLHWEGIASLTRAVHRKTTAIRSEQVPSVRTKSPKAKKAQKTKAKKAQKMEKAENMMTSPL